MDENGCASKTELKGQGFQYLAEGVNGVIPTSSWVLPACDEEGVKKLVTDLETLIRKCFKMKLFLISKHFLTNVSRSAANFCASSASYAGSTQEDIGITPFTALARY